MQEIFGLISWENMQLLPRWMLVVGLLIVVGATARIIKNIARKRWLDAFTGIVGTIVILIFMSVWGQAFLGMALYGDLQNGGAAQYGL